MRRRVHWLFIVAIAVASALPVTGTAAQDGYLAWEARLDLAAIAPAPDEIAFAFGDEPFGADRVRFLSIEALAEQQLGSLMPVPTDELLDAGWVAAYEHDTVSIAAAPDNDKVPLITYRLRVSEYDDVDGAERAFGSLTGGLETVEGNKTIGDDSVIVEIASDTSNSRGLSLSLRFDRLIATALIWHGDGSLPRVKEIEKAASVLLQRLEAIVDAETPAFGMRVLRPSFGSGSLIFDGYQKIDGLAMPRWNETLEAIESWTGTASDGYFFAAGFNDPRDASESMALQVRLLRFEEEKDASDWFEDAADNLQAGLRQIIAVEPTEGASGLGDQSAAFTITGQRSSGEEVPGVLVAVRVGSEIGMTALTSNLDVPVSAVERLAGAQADCLQTEACTDQFFINLDLFQEVDADQDEDAPSDEDDAPAGDDFETYESPQYGYVLEYDPALWTVSGEDDDPDDAYDRVQVEHELGFVTLVGDPDYAEGELGDCVADYRAGLEQGEGVDRVRKMRGESGEEEDRAWAAYTYELDTGEEEPLELVRFIECRAAADVTIVVLQTSLEEDYAELSAARDELLEGLGTS